MTNVVSMNTTSEPLELCFNHVRKIKSIKKQILLVESCHKKHNISSNNTDTTKVTLKVKRVPKMLIPFRIPPYQNPKNETRCYDFCSTLFRCFAKLTEDLQAPSIAYTR